MKVFELGMTDYVVAADVADAWAVLKEWGGGGPEDYDGDDWVEMDGDRLFTVSFRDEPDQGSETHSFSEWAEMLGRGFFASTEY